MSLDSDDLEKASQPLPLTSYNVQSFSSQQKIVLET